MYDIRETTSNLIEFRNERDWLQFHNPKDLALSINIEASELLELFLWEKPEEANEEKVKEELADIFTYALLMVHHYNLDVNQIVLEKMEKNRLKYPVDKSKGIKGRKRRKSINEIQQIYIRFTVS